MIDRERITTAEDRLWDRSIERMIERVRATADAKLDGYPHYADVESGEWTTTKDGFWTGGFWIGELWLAGYYRNDPRFWREARAWTERLASRVDSQSVFRGFLFYFGAAAGAILANDARARDLAVQTARSLARSFDPAVGLIPLGAEAEEAHAVGSSETNIDGLIASVLLLWAAAATGDQKLREIGLAHAHRTADFCVRADGSVCQSASFDRTTGELVKHYTHKGYRPDSTWTRAQAWAMLGYAACAALAPGEERLLNTAREVCRWWMENVPDDYVALWDFDAPKLPATKRDTSGTAIAAAGLLRLSHVLPDREGAVRHYRFARETLRRLAEHHLTPTGSDDRRPPGILADGCFDQTRDLATANELIWGDYFLLEGLGVVSRRLPAGLL